jgi:branched-subunit amino acid transport protein
MGLCSFLPRYLPLVLLKGREMPPSVASVLGHIPPAVLSALVATAVLTPTGEDVQLTVSNPYLVGGLVTVAVGLCMPKRFLLVSAIGIAAFFLARSTLG